MFSPEFWQAVLLGVVQGIAEFLPISSSGHLVVLGPPVGRWMGTTAHSDENLVLNVVLHLGTLLSILVVYRRAIWNLLKDFRLCLYIVLATIPLGIAGLTLKPLLDRAFETPMVVAIGWIATAGMLLVGQKSANRPDAKPLAEMTAWQAIMIGLFQAVALVPGISRSGSTISGGMLCGLRRNDAATFSFFIAIPAISAAALKVLMDAVSLESADQSAVSMLVTQWPALLAGALTSFVVGVVALKLLLKAVATMRLHWFAYYCLAMATGTLVWQLGPWSAAG